MHEIGDIVMTVALTLQLGFREVPWSVCREAYHMDQPRGARCAVYDPDGRLDLPTAQEVR